MISSAAPIASAVSARSPVSMTIRETPEARRPWMARGASLAQLVGKQDRARRRPVHDDEDGESRPKRGLAKDAPRPGIRRRASRTHSHARRRERDALRPRPPVPSPSPPGRQSGIEPKAAFVRCGDDGRGDGVLRRSARGSQRREASRQCSSRARSRSAGCARRRPSACRSCRR